MKISSGDIIFLYLQLLYKDIFLRNIAYLYKQIKFFLLKLKT